MLLNEIAQPIHYHASFDQIKKFWSLSHFGTYKAALSRIVDVLDDIVDDATPLQEQDVLLYPVRLKIDNPLRTPDIYNERPYIVGEVSDYLLRKLRKSMTDDQIQRAHRLSERMSTPVSVKQLSQLLSELGYDALSYVNKVEDPGHISYINLSSDQVEVLSKPMRIPSTSLYQLPKTRIGTWREPKQEQIQPHSFVTSFDKTPNNSQNRFVIQQYHTSMRN